MRRVRSIETEDGVTVLSNRFLDSPDPRLVAIKAPVRSRRADETVINEPQVTETQSLRAVEPAAGTGGKGNTWLGWPLFLLMFTTAGVIGGAVWMRIKRSA
jgi:hypothetical protein